MASAMEKTMARKRDGESRAGVGAATPFLYFSSSTFSKSCDEAPSMRLTAFGCHRKDRRND